MEAMRTTVWGWGDGAWRTAVAMGLTAGLAACGGEGGALDAGSMLDGGEAVDGGGTDAGPSLDGGEADAGASLDGGACACAADEVCVRGVCVASCGLDAPSLDAALAPGRVPVRHWCRGPEAFAVAGDDVYELRSESSASGVRFVLSRWALDPSTSTPAPTLVGMADYALVGAEMVFGSGYVAVSPDARHALFGYTTTRDGFVGGVFDLATADARVVESPAPGNFDAAFLDADRYLVNGAGLGVATGQGLYAGRVGEAGGAQVATGLGEASGGVALWAEAGLVVAGGLRFSSPWPDGASGSYVFFAPPASLDAASPPDLYVTAQRLALPSAFTLLPGGRFATVEYTADFSGIDRIEVRTLSVDAASGVVSAGAPAPLTAGGLFVAVEGRGDTALLLHHGGTSGGVLEVR